MERKTQFLFRSSVREFNDITNYRPNTTNPDVFKQALKSSYLDENTYDQKSARSTSSRDHKCLKGLNPYDKINSTTIFKLPLESLQSSDTTANLESKATTPRNVISYSDQIYPTYKQSSSFTTKKPIEPRFNISLKSSGVNYQNEAPFFGRNEEKQNSSAVISKRFRDQKSIDKEKLSFRDSLGSLSKQIKNTLKVPIKNIEAGSIPYSTHQNKEIQPPTPKKSVRHVRSRAGSIRGEESDSFKKQEKISSFFTNTSTNRLKRPTNLELNFNHQVNSGKHQIQQTQKNIYTQITPQPQKYPKSNLQTQRLPLGRSTVASTVFQNNNQLKYSYVVEPLTPQLRTGKKYDSYNLDKDKQQKSHPAFFQSANKTKPQAFQPKLEFTHSRNSSIVTNQTLNTGRSTKRSFIGGNLNSQANKLTQDRDSLSSRQRSSFGKEVTLNDFQLGSVKGEGRFGKFYPAVHKKTGFLVGIKEIKKESLKYMLDQFIQELKIQTYIDHPNIVKLYGYFCTKQNFYLILEYMEEGSLFSFIKKSKKLQEQEASTKLKQICSAVEYLHENEVLHRDIKPENIVMTCDVCKLCDFGWAVYSSTRRKTYCGTLDYVCPQILQGDSYDACVDIWAIGVLAYEMIVGKAPFYNISRKETMKKIMECNFEVPKQLSRGAKDFVLKALNKNPEFRQSIQALSKHQFLN